MAIDPNVFRLCTDGKNFASVATVLADGSPQVSIMWVDSDGENIVINSAEGRLKTKNLRRDPRVALAIADSDNHYDQVMVRGRVVEDTHEGADDHVNQLAKKYLGVDEYPHRQPGEVRVIFKIKPEKVFRIEA